MLSAHSRSPSLQQQLLTYDPTECADWQSLGKQRCAKLLFLCNLGLPSATGLHKHSCISSLPAASSPGRYSALFLSWLKISPGLSWAFAGGVLTATLGSSRGTVIQKCWAAYTTSMGKALRAPWGKAHKQRQLWEEFFCLFLKAMVASVSTGQGLSLSCCKAGSTVG